jgi:hypothetical protein
LKIRAFGAWNAEVWGQAAGLGCDGNKLLPGIITKKKQDVFRGHRQLVFIPDDCFQCPVFGRLIVSFWYRQYEFFFNMPGVERREKADAVGRC